MTSSTKRILFYSLLLVFLLLSPLLIAKSVGYSIDFTHARLERKGGVFIKSKMSRISIFLDGAFVRETSFFSGGALLTNVDPGTHLMRLEKAHFRPWSKTVLVEPMTATTFRNVLLIPNPIISSTSTPFEFKLIAKTKENELRVRNDAHASSASPKSSSRFRIDKNKNLLTASGTSTLVVASNVELFKEIDGMAYFIDKNGFLARLNQSDFSIQTIGRPGFYLNSKGVEFINSEHGNLFILDSGSGLYMLDSFDAALKTITGGVTSIAFDERYTKLIIKREQSADVMWLEDNTDQPFQKKGTRKSLIATNVPIRDAVWYFGDNAHVVVHTRDDVFLTEIDDRGGTNTVTLISGNVDEIRTTPEAPTKIFYLKGKVWYTIEI